MHVLGIDAGGTKTVCLLADGEGRIVAEARGSGANLQSVGELEVEKVLHALMEAAVAKVNDMPAAICLGIAGVDRPSDSETIRSIMHRIGYKARTLVVNDALVALEAGAADQPGVVIVAGTGSIAYGRNRSAQAARAGGWGYLIGDEGGGFWVGRSALAAVVRQFDGRGPATQLTDLVLRHMGLASPTELIHEIYYRDLQRRAIAGLAALVHRAANEGDAVAAQILTRAGTELATAAASVITRLGMRGDAFPTVLSGGIFRGVPSLAADVAARLSEVAPRSAVSLLQVEPAVGAVRLALAAARGEARVPTYV
jgi:N-acetylglucosamine kinase